MWSIEGKKQAYRDVLLGFFLEKNEIDDLEDLRVGQIKLLLEENLICSRSSFQVTRRDTLRSIQFVGIPYYMS